jgi:transcriptional regulator with XRE-family HTH domain
VTDFEVIRFPRITGADIRARRRAAGVSQRELARALGYTSGASAISQLESRSGVLLASTAERYLRAIAELRRGTGVPVR